MRSFKVILWLFIFCAMDSYGMDMCSANSKEKTLLNLDNKVSEKTQGYNPYAEDAVENDLTGLGLSYGTLLEESGIKSINEKITDESSEHEEGNGNHHMSKIKLSKHEWVSTSQKGYGVAVIITVLAGVVFGATNFKRPY